jgi:hypothetical protein
LEIARKIVKHVDGRACGHVQLSHEVAELLSSHFAANIWTENYPDASGLYWWWNGDEDSLPVPVNIAYSATDNSYFATIGQHGWNAYQPVTDMGGFWMRLEEPSAPNIYVS